MVRTDLAIESREIYSKDKEVEIEGVIVTKDSLKDIDITRIEIVNENGSKSLAKPKGNYITLEIRGIEYADHELKDNVSIALRDELLGIIDNEDDLRVLVVGLGNKQVTPDALGPLVVSKIKVTRHLFISYKKDSDETMSCVSSIIPGVMGMTGIETMDIIKGIVEKTKPNLIIAIDALAARKKERINTTIQITDTGISPGAGVGNHRSQLNEESLGVKVIAIGVPTVISSYTVVVDTLREISETVGNDITGKYFAKLNDILQNDESTLEEIMVKCNESLIVTPNNIDSILNNYCHIISTAINMTLHKGLELQDINKYLN